MPCIDLVANLNMNNLEEFKKQVESIVNLVGRVNTEIEKLNKFKPDFRVSIVSGISQDNEIHKT